VNSPDPDSICFVDMIRVTGTAAARLVDIVAGTLVEDDFDGLGGMEKVVEMSLLTAMIDL
jgi:hypothetical protein